VSAGRARSPFPPSRDSEAGERALGRRRYGQGKALVSVTAGAGGPG
jgi:hypothetical protein